jgi:hypothetical protein
MPFERKQLTLDDLPPDIDAHFVDFLRTLDWNKTALYYENESGQHSGRQGYRVVHFKEKVEEKWHNVWGMTWHGISACMH